MSIEGIRSSVTVQRGFIKNRSRRTYRLDRASVYHGPKQTPLFRRLIPKFRGHCTHDSQSIHSECVYRLYKPLSDDNIQFSTLVFYSFPHCNGWVSN
jgi:hypothetical protein